MMQKENGEMSTDRNQYEIDLNAIKRKTKKSEYTDFVQVRLTPKTKKELVEFCRQENIYVSTLLREMAESYLTQIND